MDILGFALAVLLIELTPGPNMAWLAGLAATEGRRSGLAAVAGVALGLLLNGVLAALGLAVLLAKAPGLWNGLRIAGALMMAWIAFDTWRASGSIGPATRLSRRAFTAGLAINLANPKAYLFFAVVVPQFVNGRTLQVREALLFAAISTTIATLIHLAIVLAGSRAQAWLTDPRRMRLARRGFAIGIMGVAISFLMLRPG